MTGLLRILLNRKISKAICGETGLPLEDMHTLVVDGIPDIIRRTLKRLGYPDNAIFLVINYDFVFKHFEHLLDTLEGGDAKCKTRWVLERLFRYFTEGLRIVSSGDTPGVPKVIFQSTEEIVDFFVSVRKLYSGNASDYYNVTADMIYRAGGGVK